jgi:hypothetical protein
LQCKWTKCNYCSRDGGSSENLGERVEIWLALRPLK